MFQEQAHDAKLKATSPEDTEDPMIPLPSQGQQSARRRGGISAEPVTEEDATSYVKKVIFFVFTPAYPTRRLEHALCAVLLCYILTPVYVLHKD